MSSYLHLYGSGNEGCEIICANVPRLDSLPEGWSYNDAAKTAPKGWRWANNGKSRFGKDKEYRHALIKAEA